jgi:hypothetical protein
MRERLSRSEIDAEINGLCVWRHELCHSYGEVVHNEQGDQQNEEHPPSLEQSLSAYDAHGRDFVSPKAPA